MIVIVGAGLSGIFIAHNLKNKGHKLPNDKILVLDNARIHHATKVLISNKLSTIKELSDSNIDLKYLPPYTPTLNPVELCFNIIRTYVNKNKPRTFNDLLNSIKISMDNIDNKCINIIKKVWNL
jgi:transposase